MSAYLSVQNVGMRFGGLQALDDVSFEVERGSIVGLIGPNGSGKTTLMNIISGVYKPTAGSVTFKGVRISSVPTYKISNLGIGRTFQVVRPFTNLNVLENVAVGAMYAHGGASRSIKQAFDYAAEKLELVGLDRVASKPASDLTVPDRKRLEVAKALALDPEVLLLDEVMAGLNLTEIDEAVDLLRRVNERGVTLIVVEHVMKAIMSISQTVVVLAEGVKIAEGEPHAVTTMPEVVEAYLGSRFAKRQQTDRARAEARAAATDPRASIPRRADVRAEPEPVLAPEPEPEPVLRASEPAQIEIVTAPDVEVVVERPQLFRRSEEHVVEVIDVVDAELVDDSLPSMMPPPEIKTVTPLVSAAPSPKPVTASPPPQAIVPPPLRPELTGAQPPRQRPPAPPQTPAELPLGAVPPQPNPMVPDPAKALEIWDTALKTAAADRPAAPPELPPEVPPSPPVVEAAAPEEAPEEPKPQERAQPRLERRRPLIDPIIPLPPDEPPKRRRRL
jgi:branched-chain amino acid transport system ATP-binding protein